MIFQFQNNLQIFEFLIDFVKIRYKKAYKKKVVSNDF